MRNNTCCLCCSSCCRCKKISCRDISIKRYFLPFILVIFITFFKETRTMIYLPIIVGFCSLILFWNYPWIVYYTASKPLYYEDLFIDIKQLPNYNVDYKLKNKFNTILVWVLITTNSILMGVLSDIWIIRTNSETSTINILAITGGVIKIFQIINNTISRIMLKILRKFIVKQSNIIRESKVKQIKNIVNLKYRNSMDEKELSKVIDSYDNENVVIDTDTSTDTNTDSSTDISNKNTYQEK